MKKINAVIKNNGYNPGYKRGLPVKVASCMVKGGYEQMPEVYGAVISWVNDNGYECAGPMFNIYHVSPHETHNPDEYVTEVCYAVK